MADFDELACYSYQDGLEGIVGPDSDSAFEGPSRDPIVISAQLFVQNSDPFQVGGTNS